MGFLQNLSNLILNPVLGWMLDIPPLATIAIVSVFVSIISVLFQKHFTNQDRLKFLKKETKKNQEELKKYRNDPEKTMKLQKEMMPLQMEMMKESFKPALWTMIPFLLLFIWLSGHFAFLPLMPGEEFTVTATVDSSVTEMTLVPLPELTVLGNATATVVDKKAEWTLSGDAGGYALQFYARASTDGVPDAVKNIVITNSKEYETPVERFQGVIKTVQVGNKPLKPLDPFTIFGWHPGWIWIYIICSLIFSMGLRKLLNVA